MYAIRSYYALFGNHHEAISALENVAEPKDAATLGMLYANIGDLTLSKEHRNNFV